MILQTSTGREIEHSQSLEIDEAEVGKLAVFHAKHGPLTERHPPTGFYNCHGMTFASRRAWVYGDGNTIELILDDDTYVEIEESRVLPGDVILYFGRPGEGVLHSGIVVEVSTTLPKMFRVCSKWGQSSEFLHWANNSPYGYNVKFFRTKRT